MRNASGIIVMVTSLGLAIALRNTIRAIWGADAQNYSVPLQKPIITEYFYELHPSRSGLSLLGLAAMFALHFIASSYQIREGHACLL